MSISGDIRSRRVRDSSLLARHLVGQGGSEATTWASFTSDPGSPHSRASAAPCGSRRSACLLPPPAAAGSGPQFSSLTLFYQITKAPIQGAFVIWRRVRDSNPRRFYPHSISSAAPSTTRTTLHIGHSAKECPYIISQSKSPCQGAIPVFACSAFHAP